jgi:glycosyltransferase involved in cell wall biosynthesis
MSALNEVTTVTPETAVATPRVLSSTRVTLPDTLARTTDCLPRLEDIWIEKMLRSLRLNPAAERVKGFRGAIRLFRAASRYSGVVTCGDFEGLAFAMLQGLRGSRRPVHVMFDCLWYGGGYFKRRWMRYCLNQVDRCVVWASVELERYAQCYCVPGAKFLFVPHHHTTRHYNFNIGDDGYVFTGGNWSRDYKLFVEAVRDLPYPCVIATTRARDLLTGVTLPPHVQIVSATPERFRQLMARSTLVVLPMQADQLHAGGQQTFLNAMLMGKPVVVTDPEGARDYIQNSVNGWLVPYGNRAELKEVIGRMMSDPVRRKAMGEEAKRFATPLTTEACNALIWQELHLLIGRRTKLAGA